MPCIWRAKGTEKGRSNRMEQQTERPQGGLLERMRGKGLRELAVQFIKFGIVGVSNTLISLAVYYVCFNLLHMHHQLANFLGFLIGVINSYFWNSRYVFKMGKHRTLLEHLSTFARTFAGYGLTSYLLGAALLWLWVDVLGISANLAPIINLVFTVPLNFIINKFWAFRKKPAGQADEEDVGAAKPEGAADDLRESNNLRE